MILTKEVEVTVNYLNIRHYISLGYVDIKCNKKIVVKVKELPMESNIKITRENIKTSIAHLRVGNFYFGFVYQQQWWFHNPKIFRYSNRQTWTCIHLRCPCIFLNAWFYQAMALLFFTQ